MRGERSRGCDAESDGRCKTGDGRCKTGDGGEEDGQRQRTKR